MHDNFFHTFFQLLTGQTGDQAGLPDALRWFTVVLYWSLFLGGIGIAIHNWRRDPAQRTARDAGLFLMRFTMGGLWFLGSLWKLPLPVSGGFQSWMEQSVKFSQFGWHSAFMQVFLDHIAVVGPLVYLLELFLATSLMLGILVRVSGIVAALFTFNLLLGLYNDPTEWPWTYMGIIFTSIFMAMDQAGYSLGLDRLVSRHLADRGGHGTRASTAARWAFPAA